MTKKVGHPLDASYRLGLEEGMSNSHPLAKYRLANDRMSQEALGAALGVTGVTVSRWENGVRLIDKNKLADVAKLTGIPARDLRPDLAELMSEAP